MIRFAIPALLLGGALFSIQPAAGHCYRYWAYPTPQRCGVEHARQASQKAADAAPDRSWYVEVVTAAPAPAAPLEADQRTPAEIQDFDEHYEAIAKYHDEINRQMIILHAREDAERAAGIEGAR